MTTNQPKHPASAGKHTPGPWFVTGWKNTLVNVIVKPEDGDPYESTLVTMPGATKYYTVEEAAANARLIAAAPELLEALKQISIECADTPASLSEAALGLIQTLARKAIAKAEGHT